MFYFDPVCGKKIHRQKAQVVVKHGEGTYYLCCPVCQRLFEQDPEKYIRAVPKRARKLVEA
ncbi:MAG: YHS domain-containing protein [Elusimicrobia bacterium]|nr:YHS domain-containing protein [Elusimicrobiota bacterium]MBP9698408.1 YHS domain-containing protein [Elusimicrobiota bacterium]